MIDTLYSLRESFTLIDLTSTDALRESMITHIVRADLTVSHKLKTLIEWGRFNRAADLISQLKKSQSGRRELKNSFAKTLTHLFVLGEAEAIELLLMQDLADVEKEMNMVCIIKLC